MFWTCAGVLLWTIIVYLGIVGLHVQAIGQCTTMICRGEIDEKKGLRRCDQLVWHILMNTLDLLLFVGMLRYNLVSRVAHISRERLGCLFILGWMGCQLITVPLAFHSYLFWISTCFLIENCSRVICLSLLGFCFVIYLGQCFRLKRPRQRCFIISLISLGTALVVREFVLSRDQIFIRSLFMLDHRFNVRSTEFIYAGIIAAQSQPTIELANLLTDRLFVYSPSTLKTASPKKNQ
ncbi:hypothetical protein NEHOM01_1362 [Nematocida homosporus]|uniref:uncharacterized protein n=1 Tax=Nematocida homosporus TaxID=1912981 RepID=UPI00221F3075|nr:uncharacterized protein NEHOM01_1362 [Nematocida homosporus]KAI5186273.1 hypothetical protein NEHOM01_1362 [Nematocida homosporus]